MSLPIFFSSSGIRSALTKAGLWWLDGLKIPLPEKLQKTLFPQKTPLVILINAQSFTIELSDKNSSHSDLLKNIPHEDSLENLNETIEAIIKTNSFYPFICLEKKNILLKRFQVPRTKNKKELAHVIAFELQRLLPFSTNEFHYDYFIENNSSSEQKITVRAFIVPSTHIKPLLEQVSEKNRTVPITFKMQNNVLASANFSTLPGIKFRTPYLLPFKFSLGVFALIAFAFLLIAPLLRYDYVLKDLNAEVESKKTQAFNLRDEITSIAATNNKDYFLANIDGKYFPPITLINTLSEAIPLNTWLQSFSLGNQQLQLQGESPSAAETLALVESTPFLEQAEFSAPVRGSTDGKQEQFQIMAKLRVADEL